MPLRLIRTKLTATAEAIYLEEIKTYLAEEKHRELILMVPDRFSYNAEKLICDTFGGVGLGGVEVLTFQRLLRKTEGADSALSTVGKQMLLKSIINKTIDESSVFFGAKERQGFTSSVLDVIYDWKRFCILPESLKKAAEKTGNSTTAKKLESLIGIYEEYISVFEEKGYTDEEDLLFNLAESIKEKDLVNTIIWIDSFVEFTEAELNVIKAYLDRGASVNIFLPEAQGERDDVSFVPQHTYEALKRMYPALIQETAETQNTINPAISFICDTYDLSGEEYKDSVKDIKLVSASDVYEETELAAKEILDLVCDRGYDFSDISVLCGSPEKYTSCIEAVFERCKIPYFSDYKMPLSNTGVSILLTTVFDIADKKSFPLHSVLRYLKTGYVLDSAEDADYLTAFAARKNIKGSMWEKEKYFESIPTGVFDEVMGKKARAVDDGGRLLALRKAFAEPLLNYYENSKGKKSVKEHIGAFFRLLQDINLYEKIRLKIDYLEKAGDENEAARLTHIWNLIINIFDQMVVSLDGEKINRQTFGEYVKSGIEGSDISLIPTVTNGVSVSDAGHRNGGRVKALFILGATRDTVPAIKTEDGIITEDEIEVIDCIPKTLGKTSRNLSKEFELLSAISEASEVLYISYAKADLEGAAEEKSHIFELIKEKFEGLDFEKKEEDLFVGAPEVMLRKLLIKLSGEEELGAEYECIKDWFSQKPEYEKELELINKAEEYKNIKGKISGDISSALYSGYDKQSISRLEEYFKCPFMYFMDYGLRLDAQETNEVKSTDTGSIVHHALALFCEEVEKTGDFKNLTDDAREKIVHSVMDEIKEKSNPDNDPKLTGVLERVEGTVLKAAELINLMFVRGKYSIYGNEIKFDNLEIDEKTKFHGIIDRLDVFEENGKVSLRVVDYKTGEKEFNFADALNGIDLQLVIYAIAAEKLYGGGAEVRGFFYNSLKKKIAKCNGPEEIEKEIKKQYKLSGIVIEDRDKDYEVKTGADMDSLLLINKESDFLPLALKKDDLYTARSNVSSPDILKAVYRSVKESVKNAGESIRQGDVRAYPYVHGKHDSCRFCDFKSICMYDRFENDEVNDGSKGRAELKEIEKEAQL